MKFIAVALFSLALSLAANAQIEDPLKKVRWTAEAKATAVAGEYDVVLTATIEKGWYTYSQTLDKGGPIPTAITLKKGQAGAELLGKAKEQSEHKKEGIDPNFGVKVVKFSEKVTFTQHVKVKDTKQPLRGTVEFMTCDNSKCLPPAEYDFAVTLPAATGAVKEGTTVKKDKKKEVKGGK